MYWAAACGGCDIAVLNLHEALLDVAERFEIAFWPAVMDAKTTDVVAMPDRSIAVTLFSGGIRTSENAEMARLLRRKSELLVAFGSCAGEGCIPGLANLSTVAQVFDACYRSVSTDNPEGIVPVPRWPSPDGDLELPVFEPVLRTLDQVVPVDYRVPGCPPEPARIAEVMGLLVAAREGKVELPPAGAVLGAGRSTVCHECARARAVKRIGGFRRIQEVAELDPEVCLLEQGIACCGPGTRDGCGALCPAAGMPCIGCYGPTEGVIDGGARLLSAYASVIDAIEPADIERILDGIPDVVGQFYRFGLARSLLRPRTATRRAPVERPVPVAGGASR
jgi:F420-non-reducing hydrogenase small subunit